MRSNSPGFDLRNSPRQELSALVVGCCHSWRNRIAIAALASLTAIAAPLSAGAQQFDGAASRLATSQTAIAQATNSPTEAPMAAPVAAELDRSALETPETLEDLREMGQRVGDLLGEIDPEVIKQVMRPLGRQALRIFLDNAPELSQKAIELGEQGLEELEKRAAEGLEQAEERFELERLE